MKITMTSEEKISSVAKIILEQSKLMNDERNFSFKIYKFENLDIEYDDVVHILNKFAKEGLFEIVITKGKYGEDVDNTSVISLSNIKLEDIKNRSMNIKQNDSEDTVVLKKLVNDFNAFKDISYQPALRNLDILVDPLKKNTENIKNNIEPSLELTKKSLASINEQSKKNLQPISNMMNDLKKLSSPMEGIPLSMTVLNRNPELDVLNEISAKLDKNEDISKVKSNDEVVYEIKYNEFSTIIMINDFVLRKPNLDSTNEKFFSYVFANPNRKISISEIEKEKGSLGQDISKILENLGFKGEFRQVFFSVSKSVVVFRNPITRKMLDELNIKNLRIKS